MYSIWRIFSIIRYAMEISEKICKILKRSFGMKTFRYVLCYILFWFLNCLNFNFTIRATKNHGFNHKITVEIICHSYQIISFDFSLPAGVIAFQSEYDDCHSQKLVLYRESGVLCQRLDYSSENVVFQLRFRDAKQIRDDEKEEEEKRKFNNRKMFRRKIIANSLMRFQRKWYKQFYAFPVL